MAIGGCANYNSGASGGATGNGGNTGGGATGNGGSPGVGASSGSGGASEHVNTSACTNVSACGGDIVGTWKATSFCLSVTGQLNASLIGMACGSVPITGSLQVTGTWTANSDGTYTDNTTTTGTENFTLAPSCLVISSTPVDCLGAANIMTAIGYATATCTAAANGGCNCSAAVDQSGGLGQVSPLASETGAYATAANMLTIDDTLRYAYCVSGGTLT